MYTKEFIINNRMAVSNIFYKDRSYVVDYYNNADETDKGEMCFVGLCYDKDMEMLMPSKEIKFVSVVRGSSPYLLVPTIKDMYVWEVNIF